MGTQDYKIKVEYGVSAIVLLIGVFFIFQAFTIETSREAVGPRTMPLYLAVALVLGGLWLAIRAFTGRAGDLKEGYGFLESDVKRIVMVVGCGVLFVLLFWALGYFAAVIASYIAMLYTPLACGDGAGWSVAASSWLSFSSGCSWESCC